MYDIKNINRRIFSQQTTKTDSFAFLQELIRTLTLAQISKFKSKIILKYNFVKNKVSRHQFEIVIFLHSVISHSQLDNTQTID